MVRFIFDTRHAIGDDHWRPIAVSMHPQLRGGLRYYRPDLVMEQAPTAFRNRISQELRTWVGRSPRARGRNAHQVVAGCRGIFQLNNDTAHRTARQEMVSIADLTDTLFWTLFERAHQSGDVFDPYDCTWSYYIDINSIVGGAGRGIVSVGHRGIYPSTHRSFVRHAASGGACAPVACAAVALVIHLAYTRPDIRGMAWLKNKNNDLDKAHVVARHAGELQDKLGWTDAFVHPGDLEAFVQHPDYQDYRVVLLLPSVRSSRFQTWEGPEWRHDPDLPTRTVYLHLDYRPNGHYVGVKHVAAFISSYHGSTGNTHGWCDLCCVWWDTRREDHVCGLRDDPDAVGDVPEGERRTRFRRNETCEHCESSYAAGNGRHHRCGKLKCGTCHLYIDKPDRAGHRCPLYDPDFKKLPLPFVELTSEMRDRGRKYGLWVYDLESNLVPVLNTQGTVTTQPKARADRGYYATSEEDPEEILMSNVTVMEQVPNLVCFRNVLDPDAPTEVFMGATAVEDFVIKMMGINGGRNICLAHNGSGYDTRLVFNAVVRIADRPVGEIKPILRGGKFMRLQVGNLVFMDTMLHLKGRLKDLSRQFLPDEDDADKGHFPHLFNLPENQDYVGDIPGPEYFELGSVCKNEAELAEFDAWHAAFPPGLWNFRNEIIKYCRQDVEILAKIVKAYHDICIRELGAFRPYLAVSPWLSATSASYCHKLFKRYHSDEMEIDLEDPDSVDRAAWESWCVLEPEEYYFDRCALRGGRTDIRKFHHEVSDPAWEAGERIRYIDVVSMYPFVQVARTYPVGPPVIHVFGEKHYPCARHYKDPLKGCRCSVASKRSFRNPKIVVVDRIAGPQPDLEELHRFFGIICCDVVPPKHLYHPTLVHFDRRAGKCLAALTDIQEGVFTSVELQRALEKGYTVTHVHRMHVYTEAPSKWDNFMKELYKLKLYNSKPPKREDWEFVEQAYRDRFGMHVDLSQCENRPAVKQTFKTIINSNWGKHAESVDHAQSLVVDEQQEKTVSAFMQTLADATNRITSFDGFETCTLFRYTVNRDVCRPDLHKGYLPAAIFVPAHGRLLLYDQMDALGERVLMHDTDSVVFVQRPGDSDPDTGCIWGDWEVDDFEVDHGGIREFVALGPKSYGLRAGDGTETYKHKGVSLKLAQRRLLHFRSAKRLLLEGGQMLVPQMSFVYRMGRSMTTHYFRKKVCFQMDVLKGVYDPVSTQLFPFGFER